MLRSAFILVGLATGLSCHHHKLAVSQTASDRSMERTTNPAIPGNEPWYRDGLAAWHRYVNAHLRIPEGVDSSYATASLRFIVDRAGKISNITLKNGDPLLEVMLIQLVRDSGPWMPAMQGGRTVNAYKEVQITY